MKKRIYLFTASLVLVTMSLLMGCQKEEGTSVATPDTANATPYPLKVCLVSGEELGSMGDPVVLVHEGQEIKLCCKECIKEFEGEPAKFLAKLKPGASVETEQ